MTIAFVHNNKAFLPETEAYCRFFSARGFTCEVVNKDNVGLLHRNVEWRLMGTDLSKPKEGIVKIHEYTSSSVPPARVWKNLTKAFFNAQPDYRLFLNEYVRRSFSFYDKIPYGYRDMGVPAEWLEMTASPTEKAYDFVYLGDLSPVREPERLLNCFSTGRMRDRSLLLIGKNYAHLQSTYQSYSNIHFIGPIAQALTPTWLKKASYAINFIVDKQPINKQTSTKMLEYLACGLPVVSTKYDWVEKFYTQNGGNYYWLDQDFSNFDWEKIQNHAYATPDLRTWTWEEQIKKSGVIEFLKTTFPNEGLNW